MSQKLSRRGILAAGVAASASGAAFLLSKRKDLIPPDHQGVFGVGETLTYASQRLLLRNQPLAREFDRGQISANFPAINTIMPEDEDYQRHMANGFKTWRLDVDGMVANQYSFSLDELKRFPSRTQITEHICESGWSAIAEWTGVQLSTVLNAVGIQPQAKFVMLYSVDGWWDSLDMADALHPQTLLAYGMNGQNLPIPHGAPLRLRVERQVGYKHLKFLSGFTVAGNLKDFGAGKGALGAEHGYSWYAGI